MTIVRKDYFVSCQELFVAGASRAIRRLMRIQLRVVAIDVAPRVEACMGIPTQPGSRVDGLGDFGTLP